MATLEEAIAGARRGEKWEREGYTMILGDGAVRAEQFIKEHGGMVGFYSQVPLRLDGWTRVEEPLTCPRCGGLVTIEKGYEPVWRCSCTTCTLFEWTWYPSEAAARDAWKRIGEKRRG